MSTTRLTLLERVRDSANNDAWGEFFAVYEPLLLSYVKSSSRRRGLGYGDAEAQEVVQDIFIKLYRTLPGFRLDHARGRFRTWLWRITTNAILDRVPGRKAFASGQAGESDLGKSTPSKRPKVHDEGQVDLRQIAAASEEDDDWITAYRQAILNRVLEEIRAEIEATNPNKWASFERHGLLGKPAAEVAAELGVNANLVYQNSARVLKEVRSRCLEQYEEAVAE